MKRFMQPLLSLVLSGSLVGCATMLPQAIGRAPVSQQGRVTLVLQAHLVAQRQTQAVLAPYTQASISRLDVVPYLKTTADVYLPISSATGLPTTPSDPNILKVSQTGTIDFNRSFVLGNLKPNAQYRIFAQAYDADGNLISTSDANSYAEVTLTDNDRPPLASLPLKLLDRVFAARTTVSLTAGPGKGYDHVVATLVAMASLQEVALASASLSIPKGNLPKLLTLSSLRQNTAYRLKVSAQDASSVELAASSIDLSVADDDTLATRSLAIDVPYVVSTLAGTGTSGFTNGTATTAQFSGPQSMAVDAHGNVYVADMSNNCIRKIDVQGNVTTLAGTGLAGLTDGATSSAQFSMPFGVAVDANGNVYVTDTANNCIRKIDALGSVSTFAGSGVAGLTNGASASAQFSGPSGVAVDANGNVYVTDALNQCVRKIDAAGNVTTLAGSAVAGFTNGASASAQFNMPQGVAVDAGGNVYVAEYNNHCVRKIDTSGNVTTLAGTGVAGFTDGPGSTAQFNGPFGVAVDAAGNAYVGDSSNHRVRKIDASGNVTTLAGTATEGFADGTSAVALFSRPNGVAVDAAGNVYVGDSLDNRIRKVQ